MADATLFVHGEGLEPTVVVDEDLDQKMGPFDPDDEPTLRGILDDLNLHVQTYEVYSVFSMLAAVWALQQIAAGETHDAAGLARMALGRIAVSGDFEERAVEVEWDSMLGIGFELPPVREIAPNFGGFGWATDAGDGAS